MLTEQVKPQMEEEIIPILYTQEAAKAVAWYQQLGFEQEWEHRFKPQLPAFVSIMKGNLRIFLSEHKGDARPVTLLFIRMADIAPLAEKFSVEIESQPWGNQISLSDPDGNRLRIVSKTRR